MAGPALLTVENLNAWYERSHVLQGASFEVRAGEVVSLIGRNGAGKTTALKSIMGLLDRVSGSVRFDGAELLTQAALLFERAKLLTLADFFAQFLLLVGRHLFEMFFSLFAKQIFSFG